MTTVTTSANGRCNLEQLHAGFLSLLPRIRLHAEIYFRDIRCPHRKEDAVAEVIALTWKWYLRLREKGKDAAVFPSALANYAARAVRSGRRFVGQEKGKDVHSRAVQRHHGFAVDKLPDYSTLLGIPYEDALHDNTQSSVIDQVAFRLDFPRWRAAHSERDQRVMDDLAIGEQTLTVARKHGLSAARISQLRRRFHTTWERFCALPEKASGHNAVT